jgi:hypothetical protein
MEAGTGATRNSCPRAEMDIPTVMDRDIPGIQHLPPLPCDAES